MSVKATVLTIPSMIINQSESGSFVWTLKHDNYHNANFVVVTGVFLLKENKPFLTPNSNCNLLPISRVQCQRTGIRALVMKFYPPETERIVCMNNCVGSSRCVPGGPMLGVLWRLTWFEPLYGTCQWTVKDYTGPFVCFNCWKKGKKQHFKYMKNERNIRMSRSRMCVSYPPLINRSTQKNPLKHTKKVKNLKI